MLKFSFVLITIKTEVWKVHKNTWIDKKYSRSTLTYIKPIINVYENMSEFFLIIIWYIILEKVFIICDNN